MCLNFCVHAGFLNEGERTVSLHCCHHVDFSCLLSKLCSSFVNCTAEHMLQNTPVIAMHAVELKNNYTGSVGLLVSTSFMYTIRHSLSKGRWL